MEKHQLFIHVRKARIAYLISALFLISVVFLIERGSHGRIFISSPKIIRLQEPQEAFRIWDENGVRGRILFSFDRRLNANAGDAPLSGNNYIQYAIRKNIVRKIYHIVPDEAWNEVSDTLKKYSLVTYNKGYFRLFLQDGSPVLVMRIRDIGRVDEKVLLNISGSYWSRQQLSNLVTLLKTGILASDIITVGAEIPGNVLDDLMVYEKPN